MNMGCGPSDRDVVNRCLCHQVVLKFSLSCSDHLSLEHSERHEEPKEDAND